MSDVGTEDILYEVAPPSKEELRDLEADTPGDDQCQPVTAFGTRRLRFAAEKHASPSCTQFSGEHVEDKGDKGRLLHLGGKQFGRLRTAELKREVWSLQQQSAAELFKKGPHAVLGLEDEDDDEDEDEKNRKKEEAQKRPRPRRTPAEFVAADLPEQQQQLLLPEAQERALKAQATELMRSHFAVVTGIENDTSAETNAAMFSEQLTPTAQAQQAALQPEEQYETEFSGHDGTQTLICVCVLRTGYFEHVPVVVGKLRHNSKVVWHWLSQVGTGRRAQIEAQRAEQQAAAEEKRKQAKAARDAVKAACEAAGEEEAGAWHYFDTEGVCRDIETGDELELDDDGLPIPLGSEPVEEEDSEAEDTAPPAAKKLKKAVPGDMMPCGSPATPLHDNDGAFPTDSDGPVETDINSPNFPRQDDTADTAVAAATLAVTATLAVATSAQPVTAAPATAAPATAASATAAPKPVWAVAVTPSSSAKAAAKAAALPVATPVTVRAVIKKTPLSSKNPPRTNTCICGTVGFTNCIYRQCLDRRRGSPFFGKNHKYEQEKMEEMLKKQSSPTNAFAFATVCDN